MMSVEWAPKENEEPKEQEEPKEEGEPMCYCDD